MKKVLVLEDESSIRSFIVINLRRAGYEVIEAGTGEEALEMLQQHSDIRVALLDVMLPGIDGFEVCRRIRATNSRIGIIMLTARHAGGRMDKALTSVNQVLMAIPAFVTGILLTYVFGLVLRWFVPGNYVSPGDNFGASLWYFLFPAVSIALPRVAMTVKMLRSSILSEMEKDYVRTSHSRGNSDRSTLYRHVLRNAMGPVVSFLAMTVADIVAGSVVIEQVFSLPGLGRMLLTSIANRDYPVVQAVVVIVAFWVVLVNLLADLINQRLDPRLRLQ